MELSYLAVDVGDLRIAYRECMPLTGQQRTETILLIHGFPQTSYQFRHVMPLLAAQGYRCLAPDYRGAGRSTKLVSDFRKSTMAEDLVCFLRVLGVHEPVHLLGHDIGGMIAFNMASHHSDSFKSVCWGECPLPGTATYHRDRTEHAVQQFHFIFHCVGDLAESLIQGKERLYVSHFLNKITYNLDAFSESDIDHYAAAYAEPGAMRCATGVYRAFETDAEENQAWVRTHGKCRVPTLLLSGEYSRHREDAREMGLEVTEGDKLDIGVVERARHYLAEENPVDFVQSVLSFLNKHQ